jgi:hypothetical protein
MKKTKENFDLCENHLFILKEEGKRCRKLKIINSYFKLNGFFGKTIKYIKKSIKTYGGVKRGYL